MTQYVVYSILGLFIIYFDLFMWGFSNGPANAFPYFALISGITLFIFSAPLALFLSRISSCVALLAVGFLMPGQILNFFTEPSLFVFFAVFTIPTIIVLTAALHLRKTRKSKLLALSTYPHLIFRVILAICPPVLFFLLFNTPIIIKLLLHGPM